MNTVETLIIGLLIGAIVGGAAVYVIEEKTIADRVNYAHNSGYGEALDWAREERMNEMRYMLSENATDFVWTNATIYSSANWNVTSSHPNASRLFPLPPEANITPSKGEWL